MRQVAAADRYEGRGGRHRARAVRAAIAARSVPSSRPVAALPASASALDQSGREVLLSLCELERRVFSERSTTPQPAEYASLAADLRRLIGRCGTYPAIGRRATELLGLAEVISLVVSPDLLPPEPPEFATPEPPWVLRVGLGRFVAARAPIPIAWAFAWHTNHPDRRWRAPATRCREEFASLFWLRYQQAYQSGLVVEWTAAVPELTFTYRPASPALGGRRVTVHTGLPDVRACLPEIAALHGLGERVQGELEEYARFLGRYPQARGTDEAFALLPPGVARPAAPDLRRVLEWCVAQLIESNIAIVSGATLLGLLPPQSGRINPVGGLLLAYALDRRGIGIEPDPRTGARELRPDDDVALFRRGTERLPRPSVALSAGTVLLHLAAAIGAREDLPLVCTHLSEGRGLGGLGLGEDEDHRLAARMHLLLQRQPDLRALRQRLDALSTADRATAADVLLASLGADGQLSTAEVELLTDLYALLGLDEHDLAVRLTALGGTSTADGLTTLDPERATRRLGETGPVAHSLALACAEAWDEVAGPTPVAAAVNGVRHPAA